MTTKDLIPIPFRKLQPAIALGGTLYHSRNVIDITKKVYLQETLTQFGNYALVQRTRKTIETIAIGGGLEDLLN